MNRIKDKVVQGFLLMSLFVVVSCARGTDYADQAENILKQQVLSEADWAMNESPVTVTAFFSERSAGGKNDFYSEGDYWWPDPENPDGPYIRSDGQTNPDNFVAHRLSMIKLSRIIGALASAYKITGDEKYPMHARKHLEAWFISKETMMNPNLQFAQAIKGRHTGRGIGIIDTIHLMEVAQGILVMGDALGESVIEGTKEWFGGYLSWLMSHPYGKAEMEAKNNHGTCFVMQVASFAKLTENEELLQFCADRYKNVLLPHQMADDGSFPLEMDRTKPYGYSIFNLDAMVMICQILSSEEDNLWQYETPEGKSIEKGINFLYPYIVDKSKWSLEPDVMYWEEWPVAQPFLLMGSIAYDQEAWFRTWSNLQHDLTVEEVVRNMPVKYPLIWL